MNLDELIVLFMDCQTTGANPKHGSIIEIGWARSDAFDDYDSKPTSVTTRLVRLLPGRDIPVRVQKITGITAEEIANGCEPHEVWLQVLSAADEVARLNRTDKCIAVMHFAKFEMPFLVDLHVGTETNREFPFSVICTHEIARRLFPELPRRSIRAIAGYFGYSLNSLRRCAEHINATALIWRETVKLLKKRYNIVTLEQTQRWLEQPAVSITSELKYPMSKKARRDLPNNPGVYRMMRSNGDILYVGKASSLKKRVDSYFRKSSQHPEHILEMLSQAKQLEVTKTGSVLEAAIIESDEIKRLSPPYNVALRKGDRQVWFCSNDLREFSSGPTAECRIGPLVSRDSIKRLAAITEMVRACSISEVDEGLLMVALGIPEGYAPDTQCITNGLAVFLQRHDSMLGSKSIERALTELGQKLWLQRKAEREIESDESDEFMLKSVAIPVCTPGSVCHLIESNVARGAHEICRARWLVLLSESSFGWQESSAKSKNKFLIVFERGQVLYSRQVNTEELPVPPGYRMTHEEKQRSFDLMTIDRMRVVTTEIRKMVSNDIWVRLRLSPNNVLDNNAIIRVLRRV